LATSDLLYRASSIRDALVQAGLFTSSTDTSGGTSRQETGQTSWRIGLNPLPLSGDQWAFFQRLGTQLLRFYRALNHLYLESVRGTQPAWVASWLDQGKPNALVTYSRMKRYRDEVPGVIRPDIIPTQDGMVITELDSVPGGIGLTACLSQLYVQYSAPSSPVDTVQSSQVIGGPDGMIEGFAAMLRRDVFHPGVVAIVVSEEAKDYRPEMMWMARALTARGLETHCIEPGELRFTEEGLRLTAADDRPIALIYRFYELFDLLNIPKAELVQYAAKKGLVSVTPPYKPALEEKSAFALLHHPALAPFWRTALGEELYVHLTTVMPRTWVLDPAPVPPSAVIPGLSVGGRAVMHWGDLAAATQKQRHFVLKPSGFSELAWGSRGVSVGHDLPQHEWAAAIETALAAFPHTPYVLQEFHKGRQYHVDYYDAHTGEILTMAGRARLSPYYFVTGETAELAGILATICPADKKVIHGMRDAVMVPCAVAHEGTAQ
jgi:Glutathionylspermidine synthase